MAMDLYADIVATLALLIALGTAARQAYVHFRWNRPVLAVTGDFGYVTEKHSDGRLGMESWGFTVVATNIGETPTRLLDVCWELELADGETALVRGTDAADGVIELETRGETLIMNGVFEPTIPLTIAKFDAAEWEFHRDVKRHPLIAKAVRGRPVVTYVSRSKKANLGGGNPNTSLGAGEWRNMNPAALQGLIVT